MRVWHQEFQKTAPRPIPVPEYEFQRQQFQMKNCRLLFLWLFFHRYLSPSNALLNWCIQPQWGSFLEGCHNAHQFEKSGQTFRVFPTGRLAKGHHASSKHVEKTVFGFNGAITPHGTLQTMHTQSATPKNAQKSRSCGARKPGCVCLVRTSFHSLQTASCETDASSKTANFAGKVFSRVFWKKNDTIKAWSFYQWLERDYLGVLFVWRIIRHRHIVRNWTWTCKDDLFFALMFLFWQNKQNTCELLLLHWLQWKTQVDSFYGVDTASQMQVCAAVYKHFISMVKKR